MSKIQKPLMYVYIALILLVIAVLSGGYIFYMENNQNSINEESNAGMVRGGSNDPHQELVGTDRDIAIGIANTEIENNSKYKDWALNIEKNRYDVSRGQETDVSNTVWVVVSKEGQSEELLLEIDLETKVVVSERTI